ncbi:MAG: prepilin-type N-terminal cleavage/methylation domain-containing protein, partial [Rhizobacter sp.]|nr:prepilin-type N-terminal cleavage/methylation domain-containing protein [Rhizobacter sp.]
MSVQRSARPAAGMTLVELMVGMAVGLFVATVAIATFVSTRSLNVVNAATTRMSENGRLAMEILQADLRNAGFAGCRPFGMRVDDPTVSVLNGGIDAGFITEGNSGLRGHRGTGSGFSPALSTALSVVVPAPLSNSDIVSVRVPADQVALGVVAAMPSSTAAPQLKAATPGNRIRTGDVVLIANCKASTIFQVTEADPFATGVLNHAV